MIRKILALLVLTVSCSTQAATIHFVADLDGAQANAGAGTGSPGTGSAVATLNDVNGLFSWEVEWTGLVADVTVAHFHGPAGPDANAAAQVTIQTVNNPSAGNQVLTVQQQADLLNGLWYVNVHSAAFPGGEIRGQVGQVNVIPLPAAAWLFGSAVLGLAVVKRQKK
ncbi:MAG: CHRD domain-containing protein [Pseudomonadales bacterium]|nr:CHRD domain-containing protein [Halioglobus sp.]MCP5130868.1 CHRD domain-containing protein [Pseudomonadales bacterium]